MSQVKFLLLHKERNSVPWQPQSQFFLCSLLAQFHSEQSLQHFFEPQSTLNAASRIRSSQVQRKSSKTCVCGLSPPKLLSPRLELMRSFRLPSPQSRKAPMHHSLDHVLVGVSFLKLNFTRFRASNSCLRIRMVRAFGSVGGRVLPKGYNEATKFNSVLVELGAEEWLDPSSTTSLVFRLWCWCFQPN